MNTLQKLSVAASTTILALGVSAGSAHAIALTTDGTWTKFYFDASGSTATPTFQFTIDADQLGTLDVTDAFFKGDVFEVFRDATSLGKTSVVPTSKSGTTDFPDVAFADPSYSKGSFNLGSGFYNIIIKADSSPFGGGGSYLRATTRPVPVPGAIFGVIVAGGALIARQRKNSKAKQTVA